ncbi:hypothetical protein C162_31944 [Paenibacillus sp. FSL R7-269]|uniref:hypothetical protein n=1 Tax=Paenibacillus sp. FSL R7-269 TaxID=1226755 RepID=UPI0003E1EF80|nr:hypothetical protein [Paenibacillus sp. FSL R7-269]ETT32249.1 hypothetical protein C162_31944 [Paenibacillus sp. FSL R7-269]
MQSIHDNEIVSYNIDLQNAKITLHTLGGKGNLVPVTIEFVNVLMHRFETQLRGSIILDISKFEISRFVKSNKELLEEQKDSAWPMYYEKIEDLLEYLINEQYNCYVISASYGLNGWVIAKEYSICN